MLMRCAGEYGYSNAVDIYDATSGRWTTASLSVARGGLAATSLPKQGFAMFAGGITGLGVYSNAVDIFDAKVWTTAVLSKVRQNLDATSLPNQGLAIFAGGVVNGTHVFLVLSFC